MKSELLEFLMQMAQSPFLRAVALAIVFDTIMGVLRACKENSIVVWASMEQSARWA